MEDEGVGVPEIFVADVPAISSKEKDITFVDKVVVAVVLAVVVVAVVVVAVVVVAVVVASTLLATGLARTLRQSPYDAECIFSLRAEAPHP